MWKRKYLLVALLIIWLVAYFGCYFFFKWKCSREGVVFYSDPWKGGGASGVQMAGGTISMTSNEWVNAKGIVCRDPGFEFFDLTCDVLNTIYFPLQRVDVHFNDWAVGFRKFSER